ncbi:MAG TPA: hypothetical protein VL588_06460, partial [Bdellovibrionota bacterium]|nr:hypothetical protein [Bdellovibrionota bacterium]
MRYVKHLNHLLALGALALTAAACGGGGGAKPAHTSNSSQSGATLALSPATADIAVNNTVALTATGGTSPYTYSVLSGGGSVDTSGVYTAPASSGVAT